MSGINTPPPNQALILKCTLKPDLGGGGVNATHLLYIYDYFFD